MENIGEVVINKVKAEALSIIKDAEARAREEREEAKRQRELKLQEEKQKVLREAREEATRIVAQASIKSRQELSNAKNAVINKLTDRIRQDLSEISSNENYSMNLIQEAVEATSASKIRIYVPPRSVDTTRKLLKSNKQLATRVTEVKEANFTGGIIAENIDGTLRIDNSYESRLEMLLPILLPEISNKFFKTP
ncbi:MAG: V-type ATP synthase subunit E [Dehalococcoidia bacterium]|nr:V-type ATP synthase subunit E [Dehalococcoidia bacterium]